MIYVDDMSLQVRRHLAKGGNKRLGLCHMSSDVPGEADALAQSLGLKPEMRRAWQGRRVYWFLRVSQAWRLVWKRKAQSVPRKQFAAMTRMPYRAP